MSLRNLNDYAALCHQEALRWWHDPVTGERIERNKGEMIALMHSELSEMMEAERKNAMDDKLPYRRGAEVELADLLIRAFDYAGAYGFDLEGAVHAKLEYNRTRQDHSNEARRQAGGKKW